MHVHNIEINKTCSQFVIGWNNCNCQVCALPWGEKVSAALNLLVTTSSSTIYSLAGSRKRNNLSWLCPSRIGPRLFLANKKVWSYRNFCCKNKSKHHGKTIAYARIRLDYCWGNSVGVVIAYNKPLYKLLAVIIYRATLYHAIIFEARLRLAKRVSGGRRSTPIL